MNNREREFIETESVHIYIALRRKKENDSPELCFREIAKKDDEVAIDVLKAKIRQHKGVWRIYRTVNKRKVSAARKILMKRLIDEPERFEWRIDSLWKNCLLQKECKAEKNFMIDIDEDLTVIEVYNFIQENKIHPYKIIKTPNGYHLLCEKLDTRYLQGKDIEIKRDDIYFIERFKIK